MTKEANAFTASDIGNSDAKEDHNEREDLAHMPPISLQTGDSAGEDEWPEDADHSRDRNRSFARKASAFTRTINLTSQRIRALLHTSVGQDCVLASVEYLAHALHYLILSRHWLRFRQTLTYLRHHRKGCGGQTIVGRSTRSSGKPSQALLRLSSLFSDARFTLRLLEIFSIWANIPETIQSPVKDRVILSINIAQVFTITAYQFLENIGHLASNRVLSQNIVGSKRNVSKFYTWAARSLCLHFVLEIVKLAKEAWFTETSVQSGSPASGGNIKWDNDDDKGGNLQWRKRLWSSSIWGILSLYWSSGKTVSILEESSGALSFLADFFALKDAWADTARQ